MKKQKQNGDSKYHFPRDYNAINAWNRHAGPMKGLRREEIDWEEDWEKELEEIESENYLFQMQKE
jgi:hypothetical protein